MARSSYIYVVVSEHCDVVAAFTVKHECRRWLNDNLLEMEEPEQWVVIRLRDGQSIDFSKPDWAGTSVPFWLMLP